ncbi:hypothetical protein B0H63DRAFT_464539 [Podospora didyma]|uniref:Enoyl reductase (ER) domain-containing protein n=1 Tax=Podospora didyma TaxID=330526 RepID=A0AAE0U3W5_9PEZI|nr:hypothetical protein B0H63DRAFT_464539 [Podospora didyma]
MASPASGTMKAWQYASVDGGLEKNLVLNDDVPLPKLSVRGRDTELLVEVISASINPSDYKLPELGLIFRAVVGSPATPGVDFCGRVVKTTPLVDSFQVGELVCGRLDPSQHGSLGQFVTAPTRVCTSVPSAGVTTHQASTVGVAGITAYQAIAPNVKAGDKVFINGGSGGVGTFAIQIAKILGCHVTVTCSTPKIPLCRELGADEVIDYTAVNFIEELREGGKAYMLCVDNVGTPEDLYKAADDFLLPEGKFVQIGGAPTLQSLKSLSSRMLLPSFLGGGKRKFEFFTIHHSSEDLALLVGWIVQGKLKPVIDDVVPFEDVPKAFALLKAGKCPGKLVIQVKQE